jgi:hypothetical protein
MGGSKPKLKVGDIVEHKLCPRLIGVVLDTNPDWHPDWHQAVLVHWVITPSGLSNDSWWQQETEIHKIGEVEDESRGHSRTQA